MERYHMLLTADSEPSSSTSIRSARTSPFGENDGAGKAGSDVHQFDTKGIYQSGFPGCSDAKMKPRNKGLEDNKEMRRHRYAFQTRSQVDILDDGYRWRKYGQKIVKNSKFPRSYYKCTHKGCSVKKQVQRNSKEEEIVVTTYEGIHTHPAESSNENFEEILKHMQTYTPFSNMSLNHLV